VTPLLINSTGASVLVNGNVNVTASLVIASSQLVVSGDLALASTSSTSISVSNSTGGSGVPLNVSGCITFSGNLTINLPADYDLAKPLMVAQYNCAFGKFQDIKVVKAGNSNCESIAATPSYSTLALSLNLESTICSDSDYSFYYIPLFIFGVATNLLL